MAGTIEVSSGWLWSASSTLFDWALEALASEMGEGPAADAINEIVAENVGWLAICDFELSDRTRLIGLISSGALVDRARREFPGLMPGAGSLEAMWADTALDLLRDLQTLTRHKHRAALGVETGTDDLPTIH